MFLTGLGVFTVASLLCGAAQSQEMLVAARFVQGFGGAMTSAVVLGMIVTIFLESPESRPRLSASSASSPCSRVCLWRATT
jgi:MFS family permease